MIAFLRGKVFAFGYDYVILDVSGVGYHVYFNRGETLSLNSQILLYTHQQIKEDQHSLFGFLTLAEKDLFEQIISVKGIGPKTAMQCLSATTVDQFIVAITNSDVAFLKGLPGIGAKTASQIILDLKGKLVASDNSDNKASRKIQETISGLKNLGYKQNELSGLTNYLKDYDQLEASELMKVALSFLLVRKGGI